MSPDSIASKRPTDVAGGGVPGRTGSCLSKVEFMAHAERGIGGTIGLVQGVAVRPCLSCDWRDQGEKSERRELR